MFNMYNFKLEGTFTNKPALTLDGVEVPFKTLSAHYSPAEGEESELVVLEFTLASKIGNLEPDTAYRVKSNAEGKLTFEVAAGKPPFFAKKEKDGGKMCKDCKKPMKDCTCADCSTEKKAKSFKETLAQVYDTK